MVTPHEPTAREPDLVALFQEHAEGLAGALLAEVHLNNARLAGASFDKANLAGAEL